MRQLQIKANVNNRTFKTGLNKGDDNFNVKFKSTDKGMNIVNFNSSGTIEVDAKLNDSSVQMNTPIDISGGQIDDYYDEIVFYDGGGVEGYGY